jgi:hypothetical protein
MPRHPSGVGPQLKSVQLVAGPTASQLIEIEKFSGLRAPNAGRSAARA